MKPLNELSLQEYRQAKASGMFWEWYPNATGNIDEDLDAVLVDHRAEITGEEVFFCGSLPIYKRKFFYDIIDQEAEYDW